MPLHFLAQGNLIMATLEEIHHQITGPWAPIWCYSRGALMQDFHCAPKLLCVCGVIKYWTSKRSLETFPNQLIFHVKKLTDQEFLNCSPITLCNSEASQGKHTRFQILMSVLCLHHSLDPWAYSGLTCFAEDWEAGVASSVTWLANQH